MIERFEDMLTGGHPNSLGRTIEVVEAVLADTDRMEELFECYRSVDEVVRLRVSNAMRRVQAERPDLVLPLIDQLIDEVGELDQASAQWTLPKLFERALTEMTEDQRHRALTVVKRNIAEHDDWIVLKNSAEYLTVLAKQDESLRIWLAPQLKRLAKDSRKTVKSRAKKSLAELETL